MEIACIEREELRRDLRTVLKNELAEFFKANEMLKIDKSNLPKQEGDITFAVSILQEKTGSGTKSSVHKMSFEGRIPCKKIGRKLWFNRVELESWIENGMPHIGKIKAAKRLSESV